MSSPSGFRSRGHGDDRKVYPVFDHLQNVGKPLRGSRFVHPSREQLHQRRMHVVVRAPKGTLVTVNPKRHNPYEVELKDLASPYSGAPLEPASEYGSSILYDAYSGRYTMVTTPKGGTVTPKFTQADLQAKKQAISYIHQAADEIRDDKSPEAVTRAISKFEMASRQEPWQEYHRAGLERDPFYTGIKDQYNIIHSYTQGMKESDNAGERSRLAEQARNKLLSAERALT